MSIYAQDISRRFFSLLQDQDALSFLRENLIHSFVEAIFANHPSNTLLNHEEIQVKSQRLVEVVFDHLARAQKTSENLYSTCTRLSRKNSIFSIWFQEFNDAYENYKRYRKQVNRAKYLKPHFYGESLVDIGCGKGDLLNYLAGGSRSNFSKFSGIDIADFSSPANRKFDMQVVDLRSRTYKPTSKYDTALLLSVLHHVSEDRADLNRFLENVRSLGIRRLIIEEDILLAPEDRYLSVKGIEELPFLMERQPKLKKYQSLKLVTQKAFTSMSDFLANALWVGIPEIPFPFAFRSVGDWLDIFSEWEVEEVKLLGFQAGNFNQVCHAVFVLNT